MAHTTVRVPINGSTLRWAREALHLEPSELARSAQTSERYVLAFESGDAEPTFKQLQKMAKKLDRTVAFFFTEAPAKPDVPETADYRGYSGDPIPPSLARELRRVEQHRETVLELDNNVPQPSLVGMVNRHNAAARAHELRQLLGLHDSFRPEGPLVTGYSVTGEVCLSNMGSWCFRRRGLTLGCSEGFLSTTALFRLFCSMAQIHTMAKYSRSFTKLRIWPTARVEYAHWTAISAQKRLPTHSRRIS
ncbi:hypothetical protein DDD63_08565 [Actinobaculum sp. 313]|nr:hypothetical protein DDD63_08565 [Actinobaculum sp. 313]